MPTTLVTAPATSIGRRRPSSGSWKEPPDDDEREQRERQVHVEHGAPREGVREEAADDRTHHAREAEDSGDQATQSGAVGGRKELAHHREDRRRKHAATDALQRAQAISCGIDCESPHNSVVSVKKIAPASIIRLRP